MAKCSGCSGFSGIETTDSSCGDFIGNGTSDAPLGLDLIFDPDFDGCINCDEDGIKLIFNEATDNCLNCGEGGIILTLAPDGGIECGPDGLFSTGGGGVSEKLGYTVATADTTGFPDSGTQEPFLSSADFIGDGTNDQVAIQAAIDAAVAAAPFIINFQVPPVFLHGGVYSLTGSFDTKGVKIKSLGHSIIITSVPTRVIDNSVSGSNLWLEDLEFQGGGGGAVIYSPGSGLNYLARCSITSGPVFPDTNIVYLSGGNSVVQGNTFNLGATEATDALLVGEFSSVKDNVFNTAGLFATGSNIVIQNNTFNFIHSGGPPNSNYAIGLFGASLNCLIQGNIIDTVLEYGIMVDGNGGTVEECIIQNNIIRNYDNNNTNSFDGILLQNDVNRCSVQGNLIRQNTNARFGINIATADCDDNFVTNNDLMNSGGINDAGTGTITVAGNRL